MLTARAPDDGNTSCQLSNPDQWHRHHKPFANNAQDRMHSLLAGQLASLEFNTFYEHCDCAATTYYHAHVQLVNSDGPLKLGQPRGHKLRPRRPPTTTASLRRVEPTHEVQPSNDSPERGLLETKYRPKAVATIYLSINQTHRRPQSTVFVAEPSDQYARNTLTYLPCHSDGLKYSTL